MDGDPRLQTHYLDAAGVPTECSPEAVAAVLALLGDGTSPADAVIVAWDGDRTGLPAHSTVELEDGTLAPPDGPLPFGYHTLRRADTPVGTVISAPRTAPQTRPRRWGAFLPLYALRTGRTDGVATYAELGDLFGWLRRHGGDVLLTLPLLPVYLDGPYDWSPYSPVSRRLWNELYVDYAALGATDAGPAPTLDADGLLDWPALARHRTAQLDAVAERLADDPDLHAWAAANPLALTYARFRGAQAVLGRNFRRWAVTREEALAAADPVVTRRHLVGSWLADRQLAATTAEALTHGQVLALDVALGTHADGFDVWHEGDLFVDGVAVGAPPDPIFMGGQDWGFPPVHPDRSRRTGHRYFRETLRHHLRHTGLLRLDHIMGLARQWWVPAGHPATDGCYVRYPLEELMAVACLEAHLAGAVVVGENLGTVPPEVDAQMADHGLLGISVLLDQLPTWGTDGIEVAPAERMAMTSTHDSYPLAGWWKGDDVRMMRRLELIDDPDEQRRHEDRAATRDRVVGHLVWTGRILHHDPTPAELVGGILDEVASQPTPVMIVNLEDLWGEERPQNVPGTFQEEPNWRRVATRTIDEVAADPQADAHAARIAAARLRCTP
ncbi:MAG: 4-alpha-glucanotransferase [Ilumatobacter sp.]|nr:4-alpha-glucanotransferase [Ilumatobacter sp.]MCB0983898.1 4-alpha-glucanotransferase [Ilumatobacter sp.]